MVADTGGILSHCAIVARENRIPCVVGTMRRYVPDQGRADDYRRRLAGDRADRELTSTGSRGVVQRICSQHRYAGVVEDPCKQNRGRNQRHEQQHGRATLEGRARATGRPTTRRRAREGQVRTTASRCASGVAPSTSAAVRIRHLPARRRAPSRAQDVAPHVVLPRRDNCRANLAAHAAY